MTYINEQRLGGDPVLVLDTGDALVGGGRLGERTAGAVVVAGMNLMGYTAMALGPYELSLGMPTLRQRMSEADFPILSANVVVRSTGELFTPAHTVARIGEWRAGIIGLTRTPGEAPPELEVVDPATALAEVVPVVAEEADLILVLANLDFARAAAVGMAVPGIDLIVAARPDTIPPTPVTLPDTGTLLVVADKPELPDKMGRRVGTLRVSIEPDGSLTLVSWETVPMGQQIERDPLMDQLVDMYWESIRP
jgi:2',3'-cyclic-nucleotide 2'-phosphodiesterase (5'-nucleotidase family)